ncbi:MAG: hypothetical protein OEZ65_13825 [Gemmatimonadota bacterium]|nr:hypothetical protein [Gemmatimonadota bacterium]
MATEATRGLTLERNDDPPAELLAGAELVDPARAGAVDLGGRTVSVVPREGHTPSDVTVESGEPSVVWCGDLVWNGMFPNYVDAVPSRLAAAVRALRRDVPTVYVPGHGSLADDAELGRYVDLLDDVESAARAAVSAGWSAEEAGERYRIPAALGEWVLFNPAYFQRAIGTWMKELGTD